MARATRARPLPSGYVQLPGSERRPSKGARRLGPADENETFKVSIILRRRPDGPPMPDVSASLSPGGRQRLSVEEITARYGAHPDEMRRVVAFVERAGLSVVRSHLTRRSVEVSGTVAQMSKAFWVTLGRYQHDLEMGRSSEPETEIYRGRDGFIYLPKELMPIVIGVFGLDNRTISRRNGNPGDPPNVSPLTVQQITTLYNFPPVSAQGQTVGIISSSGGLGGFYQSDIDKYFGTPAPLVTPIPVDGVTNGSIETVTTQPASIGDTTLNLASTSGVLVKSKLKGAGLKVATPNTLKVTAVAATSVTLSEPLTANLNSGVTIYFNPDGETTQDICIAAAVAQGANVGVFFTSGGQKGWVDTLGQAMVPEAGDPFCQVLSSSYYILNGDDAALPNSSGPTVTTNFINAVSAAFQDATQNFGITICIASGDTGSNSKAGKFPLPNTNPVQYGGDGKAHVQYPGSDPWVLSVGGTTIGETTLTPLSYVEYVWNDPNPSSTSQWGTTGGGVSAFFTSIPSWQSGVNNLVSVNDGVSVGRGVPDVAGNASAASGYAGLFVAGSNDVGNGTSASSPLWAGLITLINAAYGQSVGFVNPLIYNLGSSAFNPINPLWPDPTYPQLASCPPNNGNSGIAGYAASAGWDACTGWGSPDGVKLLNGLSQYVFTQDIQFWVDDSTFGADEVKDTPSYANAFWIVLEGFTPNALGITATNTKGDVAPTLSGPFWNLLGATNITPNGDPILELPGNLYTPQRIRFPYTITFPATVAFPTTGEQQYLLAASINIPNANNPAPAQTVFELVAGANPYFANINPNANNVYWLSQDLRVFTATPGLNPPPVTGPGAPTFNGQSIQDGYDYITNVITYLNQQIGYLNTSYIPPTNSDPLDTFLSQQGTALQGDSSVTPTTKSGGVSYTNFNFAIARVRLKGSSGPIGEAPNVKVFFRLFSTQTNDTDYVNTASAVSLADPFITYPSSPAGSPENPQAPLAGTAGSGAANGTINGCSLPFFADANYADNPTDYSASGINNQTIEIPAGQDSTWAFFGCFLNVYDLNNVFGANDAQGWLAAGTHHCLVAQIACSSAPIVNSNGVIENPENCDKLAQRNLQVTSSGNPGFPLSHRIPQTLDLRPSPSTFTQSKGYLTNLPDELVIDWGNVPVGSVLSLYWPQVQAAEVLLLASRLYSTHLLSATDAHTIELPVKGGAGYIPIPTAAGTNFAGLLTLELPTGIHVRQEFTVLVRRITSRQVTADVVAGRSVETYVAPRNWRYVVGTFQMSIPVREYAVILPEEENLLAILKWRLGKMSSSNRWRPVLLRYISIVEGRVTGMGGNPSKVPPSQFGTGGEPTGHHGAPAAHPGILEFTGKINGLIYDRFGDFEGFLLLTETGHERSFRGRENEIGRLARDAWNERTLISVFVHRDDSHWPTSIILRRNPARHGA